MDVDALRRGVEAYCLAHAEALGLAAVGIHAGYVLSEGGFVNRSYRVSDGRRSVHVKLSDDPQRQAAFARWWRVHERLEARYHAPRVLAWVSIPGTGFAGLASAWCEGRVPERLTRGLLEAVLPVVAGLHGDDELAAQLRGEGEPAPCWRTYDDAYQRRFVEDLETLGATRPTFVSEATLAALRREAARLERAVHTSPAFQEAAAAPIHGDLWAGNLLLAEGGAWCLLDWDDLALGDPALDLATLMGPSPQDLRAAWWRGWPGVAEGAAGERLALYARASLLDWAIDSLADWVEAEAAPEHAARVRAEKQRVHEGAWALYRAAYDG